MPAAPDELQAWLRLALTQGIGPVVARRLLAQFGLPTAILAAGATAVRQHLPGPAAVALFAPDHERDALIARTLDWVARPGHGIVTLADAQYPRLLLQTADPPPLLYLRGDPSLLARPAIAIVGSRSATRTGAETAAQFARALARAGWCIVSGLAEGIDAAAHAGALAALREDGAATSTIAVIGTGQDLVHPRRNRALADDIASHGLVITEYPLGMPPLRANFPRRNRLIAGLSLGTLVVEAAPQSGSLITARLAAEIGREVFAIPGSIHSPVARGCHALIKEGAKLVESADDVLGELRLVDPATGTNVPGPAGAAAPESRNAGRAGHAARAVAARQAELPVDAPAGDAPAVASPAAPASGATPPAGFNAQATLDRPIRGVLAEAAQRLLAAIDFDPVDADAVCERLGWSASRLAAPLLALELGGHVERLQDGRFRRLRTRG